MISVTGGAWIREYTGLSTDTKPTENVPNGSSFYEINTKTMYVFDAENGTWIKQFKFT